MQSTLEEYRNVKDANEVLLSIREWKNPNPQFVMKALLMVLMDLNFEAKVSVSLVNDISSNLPISKDACQQGYCERTKY